MLCGFAVELYLKAYLIHVGYKESELRSKHFWATTYRLLAACASKGLFNSAADTLVNFFAERHKDFTFRYMKPDIIYNAISLQIAFSSFSHLDRAIDAFIGASAARGLKPGGRWDFPSDGAWRLPFE